MRVSNSGRSEWLVSSKRPDTIWGISSLVLKGYRRISRNKTAGAWGLLLISI